jgi:hypothetical protein
MVIGGRDNVGMSIDGEGYAPPRRAESMAESRTERRAESI